MGTELNTEVIPKPPSVKDIEREEAVKRVEWCKEHGKSCIGCENEWCENREVMKWGI